MILFYRFFFFFVSVPNVKRFLSSCCSLLETISQGRRELVALLVAFLVSCECLIRIYPECESWIEKSVPKITVWRQEACRVMRNGDTKGRVFLSHPYTNNGFFSG